MTTNIIEQNPTQEKSPIVLFREWLTEFSEEELSDKDAAQKYAVMLFEKGDKETIISLMTQQLRIIAAGTQRAKTKKAEMKASFTSAPKQTVWDKVQKQTGIPQSIKSDYQKYKDQQASIANRRALYAARLEMDAEKQPIILTSDLLSSEIQVAGSTITWGKATIDQVITRFETLFEASIGDYETLVFIKAVINIMEANPGKTLEQIAAETQEFEPVSA